MESCFLINSELHCRCLPGNFAKYHLGKAASAGLKNILEMVLLTFYFSNGYNVYNLDKIILDKIMKLIKKVFSMESSGADFLQFSSATIEVAEGHNAPPLLPFLFFLQLSCQAPFVFFLPFLSTPLPPPPFFFLKYFQALY